MSTTVPASPSFARLGEQEQLAFLHSGTELRLSSDQRISEHDLANAFYVLLDGTIMLTGSGAEGVLSAGPSASGDQTPALLGTPPTITGVRAQCPSRFLRADADAYLEHIAGWSDSNTIIVGSLARRVHDTAAMLRQQEKLAALGKLAAGLAHELNNPASAAQRAAHHMRECVEILAAASGNVTPVALDEPDALATLEREGWTLPAGKNPGSPLGLAVREEAITVWLDARGVHDGWKVAPGLAEAGIDIAWLDAVAARISPASLGELLIRFEARLRAVRLLDEIERSTARIADLIGALKAYTYLDQAPVQELDLHQALENTLVILNHTFRPGVVIHREYDPALPRITAFGSELNQVWTALLDNASNAVGEQGNIWIRTAHQEEQVVVEIVDDGHGIPADIQPHIFAPFITGKAQGEGVGIGLHMAYNIVVNRHQGQLSFTSQPGATSFRVGLPLRPATFHG